MCLIFIALRQHPRYKLVVAANRDEFYDRPTTPAAFWGDQPEILGGRDLRAGGTWLGMSRGGRIAMVTNFRDPRNIRPDAPSRGALVTDFLLAGADPESHLKALEAKKDDYNGFSLIAGTVDELWYLSNYASELMYLDKGLFGLSNHLLETPWPKVEKGKQRLQALMLSPELHVSDLYEILSDKEVVADEDLPETGIGKEWERLLSAAFIQSPGYGTRSSTVILVNNNNRVSFNERVYDHEKEDFFYRSYEYSID